MSMMYCHTHDELFDTDKHLCCPRCKANDLAFCYACSTGVKVEDDEPKCPKCGAVDMMQRNG